MFHGLFLARAPLEPNSCVAFAPSSFNTVPEASTLATGIAARVGKPIFYTIVLLKGMTKLPMAIIGGDYQITTTLRVGSFFTRPLSQIFMLFFCALDLPAIVASNAISN